MECDRTISGWHIFKPRGPRRAGGLLRCACGAVQPPHERHRQSLADEHILMGCRCRGDLALCEWLTLAADLKRVTAQLVYLESTHDFLRDDLAKLRERIGRSAIRILELRAQRAALDKRIRRLRSA